MKTPASTAPSSIATGMLNAQEQNASAVSTGVLLRHRFVMAIATAGGINIRGAATRLNVDVWCAQSPERRQHWPSFTPAIATRNRLGSNHYRYRYFQRHA